MKKIIINLFACVLMAATLAGCGVKEKEQNEKVTESETEIEVKEDTNDGQDFLEITPDAKKMFPDYKVSIIDGTTGDAYSMFVEGCNKDDYFKYVEEANKIFVNLGYDIDCGDSGCVYQAFTEEDAYTMDVSYMANNNTMMIKVKRNAEEN